MLVGKTALFSPNNAFDCQFDRVLFVGVVVAAVDVFLGYISFSL